MKCTGSSCCCAVYYAEQGDSNFHVCSPAITLYSAGVAVKTEEMFLKITFYKSVLIILSNGGLCYQNMKPRYLTFLMLQCLPEEL